MQCLRASEEVITRAPQCRCIYSSCDSNCGIIRCRVSHCTCFPAVSASNYLTICRDRTRLQECPNVFRNETLYQNLFPNGQNDFGYLYRWQSPPNFECEDSSNPLCVGSLCRGLPSSIAACRTLDGGNEASMMVYGLDATAFAALFGSISVGAQVVVFMLCGSLADYGSSKRRAFMATSLCGALLTISFILVTPSSIWLAPILLVLSNVLFGFSSVLLNSFLPSIVRGLPNVQQLAAKAALAYSPQLSDSIILTAQTLVPNSCGSAAANTPPPCSGT